MTTAAAPQPRGFVELFLDAVSSHGSRPAFENLDTGRTMTYQDLHGLACRYRSLLQTFDIGRDDIVALLLPASPDLIACIYSLASLSALFMPCPADLSAYEMRRIMQGARPAGIVTTAAVYKNFKPLFDSLASLRFVCAVDEPLPEAGRPGCRHICTDDFAGAGSDLEPPRANPAISCHYTYKGLGYPLGVIHRYQEYSTAIAGCLARCPKGPGEASLVVLPVYPIYGTVTSIFYSLCESGSLVMTDEILKKDVLALLESRRFASITLVPFLFPRLVRAAQERASRGLHLPEGMHIVTGASYIEGAAVAEASRALGHPVIQGYGLTETMPVIITGTSESEWGSIGTPTHPDVTVRIADAQGRDAGPGRTGEILVGGPTIAREFLRRPEETARFLKNGFCHTGDLGYLDEQGRLYFMGRSLPITKIASQMVDLTEVEQVLASHPSVHEARVSVHGRLDKNSYIEAWVTVAGRDTVTQKELKQHCKAILSRHKVPFKITVYQKSLHAVSA